MLELSHVQCKVSKVCVACNILDLSSWWQWLQGSNYTCKVSSL